MAAEGSLTTGYPGNLLAARTDFTGHVRPGLNDAKCIARSSARRDLHERRHLEVAHSGVKHENLRVGRRGRRRNEFEGWREALRRERVVPSLV